MKKNNLKKKYKYLALIPARGGSKRLPNKNIKKFNNLPIIARSIKVAIESNIFDEVMVSTDSNKIANISKKYGAEVPFKRSKKNAKDNIQIPTVLEEVLKKYRKLGKNFEYICCIYATAPLIKKQHLYYGLKKLKSKNCNSVLSISEFEGSIWKSFKKDKNGYLSFNFKKQFDSKKKESINYYHDGQWFWFRASKFIKSKKIIGKNTKGILLPKYLSQDINTIEDWKLAEIKFKYQKNH